MKAIRLLLPLALLACVACDRQAPTAATPPAAASNASVDATPPLRAESWPLPATGAAAQPDLVRAPDGSLLLSWMETQGDAHAMKFARFADGKWSDVREIARGSDWFVNWADTPHIAQTADGALWAHWLQKAANAKYAYDVALVRSGDGGATWSKPTLVNDDGTASEHGFVSLWPAANDRIGVAWLDGRNTASGHAGGHGAAHDGHDGTMTLRTAQFDAALKRHDERELDADTCTCCQTDVAMTPRGAMLVYRGRTPEEVRDILALHMAPDAKPRPVHADGWVMPACPVNGPAVAATGNDVLVGWYTAVGDVPTVNLARSVDGGETFAAPIALDRGAPVQGRVDVALDPASAWALWLREDDNGQSLQIARFTPNLSRELQRGDVAKLQGRGRGTGFAKLALADGKAFVVWTDVVDQTPQLHGAQYRLAP